VASLLSRCWGRGPKSLIDETESKLGERIRAHNRLRGSLRSPRWLGILPWSPLGGRPRRVCGGPGSWQAPCCQPADVHAPAEALWHAPLSARPVGHARRVAARRLAVAVSTTRLGRTTA